MLFRIIHLCISHNGNDDEKTSVGSQIVSEVKSMVEGFASFSRKNVNDKWFGERFLKSFSTLFPICAHISVFWFRTTLQF